MAKTLEVTVPMLEKLRRGDALTNNELRLAIEFYTDLSKYLDKITMVEKGYDFAGQHARRELQRLELFASHRKSKRLNA